MGHLISILGKLSIIMGEVLLTVLCAHTECKAIYLQPKQQLIVTYLDKVLGHEIVLLF